MQVVSINCIPVGEAVRHRMGKSPPVNYNPPNFARRTSAAIIQVEFALSQFLMVLSRLIWKENPPQVLKK